MPETNSKQYNTERLRKNSDKITTVNRRAMVMRWNATSTMRYPREGLMFPQARSKYRVSKAEITKAPRGYFEENDPTNLIERVDTFMQGKGRESIWTLPYMPSFQPVELFWQHGKHYVSMMYKDNQNLKKVHKQIRLGWYGDSTWDGQEGGAGSCGLW